MSGDPKKSEEQGAVDLFWTSFLRAIMNSYLMATVIWSHSDAETFVNVTL